MKPTSALMPILGVLTSSLCAPLWAQESTARPASPADGGGEATAGFGPQRRDTAA